MENKEFLETKLEDVARLWVRWNIKAITGDELATRLRNLLSKETNKAWQNYVDPLKADDPLRALLV